MYGGTVMNLAQHRNIGVGLAERRFLPSLLHEGNLSVSADVFCPSWEQNRSSQYVSNRRLKHIPLKTQIKLVKTSAVIYAISFDGI